MNKRELQQAVLRAHPGVQLGAWTQNFYFTDDIHEAVGLPSMTKKPITLPKATRRGRWVISRRRARSITATLSITIWQYKSADTAAAAAKKLAATSPRQPEGGMGHTR